MDKLIFCILVIGGNYFLIKIINSDMKIKIFKFRVRYSLIGIVVSFVMFNHYILEKFIEWIFKIFKIENSFSNLMLMNFKGIGFYSLINTSNVMSLFIGLTAIAGSILIYIAQVDRGIKKHVLFESTKIKNMVISIFSCYLFLILNVKLIFLLGLIGCIIYLEMKSIIKISEVELNRKEFPYFYIKTLLRLTKKNEIDGVRNALNELRIDFENYSERKELTNVVEDLEIIEKIYEEKTIIPHIEGIYYKDDFNLKDSMINLLVGIKDSEYFEKLYYRVLKMFSKNVFEKHKRDSIYYFYCLEKIHDFYLESKNNEFLIIYFHEFMYTIFNQLESNYENSSKKEEVIDFYFEVYKRIHKNMIKAILKENKKSFSEHLNLINYPFQYKEVPEEIKNIINSVKVGLVINLIKIDKEEKNTYVRTIIENLVEKIYSRDKALKLYEFILNEKNDMKLQWSVGLDNEINIVNAKFVENDMNYRVSEFILLLMSKLSGKITEKSKSIIKKRYIELVEAKKDIETKKEKYEGSFGEINLEYFNDIEILKGTLEIEKEEEIMSSELSKKKLEEFKLKFQESLKKSRLIKLLRNLNKYKYNSEEKEEKKTAETFSISQFSKKANYVDCSKVYSAHLGKSLGDSQNMGLEKLFVMEIDKKSMEVNKNIEEIIKENKKNDKKLVMILSENLRRKLFDKYEESIISSFKLSKTEVEKYCGYLLGKFENKYPILYIQEDIKGMYILNIDLIKELVHYNPIPKEEEEKTEIIEYCSFSLEAFSENEKLRQNYIDKKPEWLKKYDDKEKVKELNKLVWLKSFQRAEIVFNEKVKMPIYKISEEDI